MEDLNIGRFVNQFICGPRYVDTLEGWQRLPVSDRILLTVHPGLSVTRLESDNRSLTLVGFAIDPYAPEANNTVILRELLNSYRDLSALIDASAKLGGRWVIFAVQNSRHYLFNDALGLRQVYFSDMQLTSSTWVMSQPGIGQYVLDLSISDDAQTFIDSYQFRKMPEYRWPAMATAFSEIKHMLPNHYLDLDTGKCQRYWPCGPLAAVDYGSGLQKTSKLLKGFVQGGLHRFNSAMGITAGLDSRTILAASKEVKEQIDYLTVRQGGMQDNHMDLTIPANLLKSLGLSHRIIKAAPSMTSEFCTRFKNNTFMAHDRYGADAEAIHNSIVRKKVVVTGSGAEVGRCSFRDNFPLSNRRKIQPQDLAVLQGMKGVCFAEQAFSDWLGGVGDLFNINILDLFEWEQGHGNWLAMTQQEMDIAWQDIFAPYNCRELLVTLLSVPEKYRRGRQGRFFTDLIKNMWPEVLHEPINPGKKKKRLSVRLHEYIRLLKYFFSG